MDDVDSQAPQTPHTSLQRVTERTAGVAIAVAAAALAGLVLVQGWQVVARYVLNDSPSWTEPVTVLLLSTAMSLGAAAGVQGGRHFSFNLLAERLPDAWRRACQALNTGLVALIGGVLAYWGGVLFADGVGIRAAGAAIPQSLPYLPLCIGGALIALFALAQGCSVLRQAPAPGGR